MSLSPVIFSDGIHQTRTEPHPTIPRCVIICKWSGDVHAYSRALPYRGADGSEAWVPAFSEYIEKHDNTRLKSCLELPTNPDMKGWLYEVRMGNIYGAANVMALCRFLGLNEEVNQTLAVVRERNRKRTEEHDAQVIKRRLDAEQKFAEDLEKAWADFIDGKMITPGMFETLCERNNVTMHIRTIGTLRKRVAWISRGKITGDLRGAGTTGIFQAIRALKEALTTPKETPDPSLDHLFGRDRVLVEIPIPKGP